MCCLLWCLITAIENCDTLKAQGPEYESQNLYKKKLSMVPDLSSSAREAQWLADLANERPCLSVFCKKWAAPKTSSCLNMNVCMCAHVHIYKNNASSSQDNFDNRLTAFKLSRK